MIGKIVAIEGIDGSGKNVQSKLLTQKLNKFGLKTEFLSFPNYEDTFFGKEIGNFLDGSFGSIDTVHPKLAAILFAGDRWEKSNYIQNLVNQGTNVVCDRYMLSNIAHQSAKLEEEEFESFSRWVEELEFKVFNVPKPDLNIFLDVPFEVTKELVLKKDKRIYTDKKEDIHEKEYNYLKKVYTTYVKLLKKGDWLVIKCVEEENLRSIESISEEMTEKVVNYLKS